mmetsp:Transcript_9374/g.14807  ORF Transcript_9374/g.14807 Transcript_9374/m.14807 type:complete len:232 (+) Transcript_9374:2950-3645(+)|eukprot:422848-Amorphochlora_amoeboformis.AAC.2
MWGSVDTEGCNGWDISKEGIAFAGIFSTSAGFFSSSSTTSGRFVSTVLSCPDVASEADSTLFSCLPSVVLRAHEEFMVVRFSSFSIVQSSALISVLAEGLAVVSSTRISALSGDAVGPTKEAEGDVTASISAALLGAGSTRSSLVDGECDVDKDLGEGVRVGRLGRDGEERDRRGISTTGSPFADFSCSRMPGDRSSAEWPGFAHSLDPSGKSRVHSLRDLDLEKAWKLGR